MRFKQFIEENKFLRDILKGETLKKSEYEKWFKLGQRAFKRGEKNLPIYNKDILNLLKSNPKVGQSTPYIKAWSEGWTRSNLDAPIKEDRDTTGLADKKNFKKEDADPKELKMGLEIEMEHTTDKSLALEIVLDHLAEIKDYYTRLKKMEQKAEKENK